MLTIEPHKQRLVAPEGFRVAPRNSYTAFEIVADKGVESVLRSGPGADVGQCHLHGEEDIASRRAKLRPQVQFLQPKGRRLQYSIFFLNSSKKQNPRTLLFSTEKVGLGRVFNWHMNCTMIREFSTSQFGVACNEFVFSLMRSGNKVSFVFLGSNCGIGLALPVEPPKAQNLDRGVSCEGCPIQKKVWRICDAVFQC